MRPSPAIFSAALAAALFAVIVAPCPAQSPGAPFPERWIEEAVRLSSAGLWADAESLLSQALSIDAANSDLLYLRGLSKAKSGRPLGEALADTIAARTAKSFSLYTDRDAAVLQAETLIRLRRWAEALAAVSSASGLASDPALRLIRAKALAGLGDWAAFVGEISYSIERFPEDPSFPRLYLTRLSAVPSSAASKSLGELIVRRSRRYAEYDPEIPILASPLMASRLEREDAIRAFRAIGGMSGLATLGALEYGLIDEAKAIKEFFSGEFAQRLDGLSRLDALLKTPEAKGNLAAAMAAWSGEIEADRDGDGIAEESFRLERGLVLWWRMDKDQDAAFEIVASFSDGLPSSAEIRSGGLCIRAVYDAFPHVAKASFEDKDGARSYSFSPGALSFSPVRMRRFVGEGRRSIYVPEPLDADFPDERACAVAALAVRRSGAVLSDARIEYEETTLIKGLKHSSRAFRDGKLYSTTAYEDGLRAIERIDEDGDGRFETERKYERGPGGVSILAWTRIDTDGDGLFDYREEAKSPYRKEWDYDGDGSVDAAHSILPDGSARGEFSSRVDGRLDETVTVKDGRIVELLRDGKPIALIPDANPAAVWIGKKPFDLGSELPTGEGFFKKSGVRYRVVRVGSIAFAEVLP